MYNSYICLIVQSVITRTSSLADVEHFGVYTSSDDWSPNGGQALTLVLWFDRSILSCTVYPSSPDTFYSCNSTSWSTINESCPDSDPRHKVLIANNWANGVGIDHIKVHANNTWFGVNSWCIPDGAAGQHGVTIDDSDDECGTNYNKYK